MVLFGGRNERMYNYTGNVGLNDVCIFNINLNQWEALAIFGQMPLSRWKHSVVADNEREGIMVFGGFNLRQHCRSKIYTFSLIKKKQESLSTATKADRVTQADPKNADM